MARLFDVKKECIWKYLLMGEAQPFDPITDFWRRVEVFVSLIYWNLYYYL